MTPLPRFNRSQANDDLGLGLRVGPSRSVNKDGTFNVRRVGLPFFRSYELHHSLITMGGAQGQPMAAGWPMGASM